MREVLIQTAEPVSTREATERLVEIIGSIYVEADLEQLASNANQLNAEERAQLLRHLQDFDD